MGVILVGQAPTGDENSLKVEIRALVRQLDSPIVGRAEGGRGKARPKGPQAWRCCPSRPKRPPLRSGIACLASASGSRQDAAESATRASLITLHSPAMPLSKVLAALQEQSGNRIIDTRRRPGATLPDPELKVDFDRTPFWQALDEVLDQAELSVYPFGQQHALCIVPRSPGQLPRKGRASYSGPFRFEPIRLFAGRTSASRPAER